MQVIVKQSYAHYNRTLGMNIRSKDHYDRVCKERGMVSLEQAHELAEKGKKENIKDYKVSDQSIAIINAARQTADKKGNIKLGDRAIDALLSKKAIGKKIPSYMQLPAAYTGKGGFEK